MGNDETLGSPFLEDGTHKTTDRMENKRGHTMNDRAVSRRSHATKEEDCCQENNDSVFKLYTAATRCEVCYDQGVDSLIFHHVSQVEIDS